MADTSDEPAAVMAKPKRPLSAFNLFYRYKRQKVLDAVSRGNTDKDAIVNIVEAVPGLEKDPASDEDAPDPPNLEARNDLQRKNITGGLEGNLLPRDTDSRLHRKDEGSLNGAISFIELGKLMNTSWKNCDDFSKSVFKELSDQGREHYHKRMMAYQAWKKEAEPAEGGEGKASPSSKKKKSPKKKGGGGNASSMGDDVPALPPLEGGAQMLELLSRGGMSSEAGGSLGMMGMAQLASLRSSLQANDTQEGLAARVKELESQLAAERLRARVRELEACLSRQRSVEEQLRAQLAAAAATANPSSMNMQDGLWSLASASMIHNPSHASERESMTRAQYEMLSRMVAAGNVGNHQQHAARSPGRAQQEQDDEDEGQEESAKKGGSSNKKQRRS